MNALTNDEKDLLLNSAILLQRLDELLGAYEPLTGDEVRRLPQMSERRDAVVAELADVCRESGLEGAGSKSVADMLFSHQEARALREQLEMLDLVRARLDAKRLLAEADLVRHVSFFYDLARNASRFDDKLRERLAPLIARFRTRKKSRMESPRAVPRA